MTATAKDTFKGQAASLEIQALQQGMVKRIDNKTLKVHLDALNTKLKLLEKNLLLLNSILKKDVSLPNGERFIDDLKRCDIELKENDLAKYDMELQENDDIDSLIENLANCNHKLRSRKGELDDCHEKLRCCDSKLEEDKINKEIDALENAISVLEYSTYVFELKIFTNQLIICNNDLYKLQYCDLPNKDKIEETKKLRGGLELKKCTLEILICNIKLKFYNDRLQFHRNQLNSGNYQSNSYMDLRQNITSMELAINSTNKRKRSFELNRCSYELNQFMLELSDFHIMLMKQPKHVRNDLCKNMEFKQCIMRATQLLAKLLLTPQIFNPKVQESLQPMIDLLYCFNQVDETIPHILQAFEKIKMAVNTTKEICESEWTTFSEDIAHKANDNDIKKSFFNSEIERILNGLAIKEILNVLPAYDLGLMPSLQGASGNPNAGIQNNKIYIDSDTHNYKISGRDGIIYQGKLPDNIDLNDLGLRLDDLKLTVQVLAYISKELDSRFFNRPKIELILSPLETPEFLDKLGIKKIVDQLQSEETFNKSEASELKEKLNKLFNQGGKEELLSKEAKKMVLCKLKEKYLGALKDTCFSAFFILKLLRLETDSDEKGNGKLHDHISINKVENFIFFIMGDYFSVKASATPYYSDHANPEKNELEEMAGYVTTDIITQMNHPVIISYDSTLKTYIDQLEACKDNGVIDLEKLFLNLFASDSSVGMFVKPPRNQVDEICATVENITQKDKELIDWRGVLIALEKTPDYSRLKKRIEFFRMVIDNIDGVKPKPSLSPGFKK